MSNSDCCRCGVESVIDMNYGEGPLCASCFISLFERRVKKNIRKHKLLSGEDKLLVGLSGGKDSMSALLVVHSIVSKNPNTSLEAVTIDEGIVDCSGERIRASKAFCDELGVPHRVVSFKDYYGFGLDEFLAREGLEANPCTYCGVLRRRLMNTKAREWGFTKVITGHNLDDEVQAALMNFVRGEVERIARLGGSVGLLDIDAFIPRIKPLRDSLEDEVRLYANLKGIDVEKSSCPHNKEAYRKSMASVIDELEEKHPGSKYQMLRSVDKLVGLLRDSVPREGVGECEVCGEPTSSSKCKVCRILEER